MEKNNKDISIELTDQQWWETTSLNGLTYGEIEYLNRLNN
jgi:hypothetical protein